MPTDLDLFASAEIKMRYREPFLTAGLNEKQAVNRPPGTYRGFRLGIGGGANVVTVTADVTNSDHVAVYETGSGFSLALRKIGGPFNLDLSGLVDVVDKTWVLCIFADYAIGVTTSAVIRAYELSPVDEFTIAIENPELIVLGTVFIEANNADPFAASEVNHDFRRMAWMAETVDSVTWQPLVRNGGFELSYDNSSGAFDRASAHWRRFSDSPSDAEWKTNDTDPRTGRVALEWNSLETAVIVNGLASQELRCPVVAGQLFKFQFYKKNLLVPTAGSQVFRLQWKNNVGDDVGSSSFTIDTSGVDGSYVKVEGVVAAITGAFFLHSVEFVASSVSYGAIASAILFDDVQVWAEGFALDTGPQNDVRGSGIPDLYGSSVVLYPPNFNFMATSTKALVLLENGGNSRGQDSKGSLRILDAEGRAQAIEQPLTGSTDTYTLLHEAWTYATSDSGVREYVTPGGELHRTVNAKFSNTTAMWTKDDNGATAMRVVYTNAGIRVDHQEAATDTWADNAWTSTPTDLTLGPDVSSLDTDNGFVLIRPDMTGQTDFDPILQLKDSAGNFMSGFDHLGLPGLGRWQEWTWIWPSSGDYTTDADMSQWTFFTVGGGAAFSDVQDQFGSFGDGSIFVTGASNDEIRMFYNPRIGAAHTSAAIVVEWGINWWVGAARTVDFWHGLTINDVFSDDMVAFRALEGDTNWQALGNANNTITDTGVAIVGPPNGVTTFRVEMFRDDWPTGPRANYFINDVLVASHTTNVPDNNIRWGCRMDQDSTGNANQIVFSAITFKWNMVKR